MNFYDIPNGQVTGDTAYKYAHRVQEIPREPKFYPNELPYASRNIISPVKPPKKESKIQRVYEDDIWVIDLIDGNLRVSYFEGNHYVDEVTITKDSFKEKCERKEINHKPKLNTEPLGADVIHETFWQRK